ncbi:hypothetical protein GLAREA_06921 [Glarea lozoyensis ATCC 20868]|uniref:Uncharacterized protein n=1 Tax=Glarea lozoyensis (strain ATCC 20868 / MF5171) TaxID=1116229 RepID=S3E6B5_GLAL2|nr:uncharacterized protein GLAREA_06921 [Glarea lozoyensis ATCC 20868]EPE33908.1 hypothetical protein GLAREA_06921 [Glarea lozoyensis ATCC 20868]
MCKITHNTFKDCPCSKTSTIPCGIYLKAVSDADSALNRHLKIHRPTSQHHNLFGDSEEIGPRKVMPDMRECPNLSESWKKPGEEDKKEQDSENKNTPSFRSRKGPRGPRPQHKKSLDSEDKKKPDTCEMVEGGCPYQARQTPTEPRRVWENPDEMWELNLRGKGGVW